jgi:hypothetical protein
MLKANGMSHVPGGLFHGRWTLVNRKVEKDGTVTLLNAAKKRSAPKRPSLQ